MHWYCKALILYELRQNSKYKWIFKDFFTTFKVNTVGKFTLSILNQGSNPVNVDGIFGYIPFVGQDNQVNLSPLNGIITGIALFVIGIIALIVGIVFVIIDRKRENRRQPPLTR